MILGRVVGNLVSTLKHPVYKGRKILLVEPVDPAGDGSGGLVVALDTVDAGPGDQVLVAAEGWSAMHILGQETMGPVRSLIVGVIDCIEDTLPPDPVQTTDGKVKGGSKATI
ncbi:MAG: EutN/CcmL family microcompartment protein [Gemmatimonadota bacterium]|nr:EutN/CcmL family microcompartment protein [Gemmatimonadota bacterium]